MAYKIPARKDSKATQFEFVIPGEKQSRYLPLIQHLDSDLALELFRGSVLAKQAVAAGEEDDPEVNLALMAPLTEALERFHPGILRLIDITQLGALLADWQKAGTVEAGE